MMECDETWVFPKIVVSQNGWFIVENLIKIDDLGGTPIFGNTHMSPTYMSIKVSRW